MTDKDIYEELFGTIGEEIDHVQADMIEKTQPDSQGNPTFKVSGKMPLDDFMRYFKIAIPQFEQTQVSTLTGFFLEQQYDLKVGQPIRVENFSFTPLDLENAYVNEFRVTVIKMCIRDRVFSYNQSFQAAGAVLGSVMGSMISGVYSYSAVFAVTGFTLLVNLGLVLLFRGKKTTPTD